jgi:hypothetical protein
LLSSGLFVVAVVCVAWRAESLSLAIYLTGFWHYLLYWLAFTFGAIPHTVFKRDAVALKAVSVTGIASVYLAFPLDPLSLAVIVAGILLNAVAAAALGADRTYYGVEVAGLPPRRIERFPYSMVAHPMILGNVLAFGGTLLNAGFREAWWPLAALHVLLNIGLLVMERHGRRFGRLRVGENLGVFVVVVSASAGGLLFGRQGAVLGALVSGHAWILACRYTKGTPCPTA